MHPVGEAPYYLMRLENVPSNMDVGQIFNYFKNQAKVYVGQIKLRDGSAIVPVRQEDLQVIRFE